MKHFINFLVISCLHAVCFFASASTSSPSPSVSSLSLVSRRNTDEDGNTSIGTAAAIDNPPSQDEWRRSLPQGLRNTNGAPLLRIDMDGGVVLYLLGSSHVSRTSCDDAKLLMQHIRPDVLFVELCSQRVGLLLDPPTSSENEEEPKSGEAQQNESSPLTSSSALLKGSLMYTKIQQDYATKLNVTIGGEFRAAFQSALAQQRHYWGQQSYTSGMHDPYTIPHPRGKRPCAIILGDRPVAITLSRAWESLRIFGKLKLMLALLWSSIRQPSEKELREWMESVLNDRSGKNDLITKAMEELNKSFPSLKRVIIEERDEFMVAKLRQTAKLLMHSSGKDGEKVIVAVVGAGHANGMHERLLQKSDGASSKTSDMAPLDRRPETVLPTIIETKKRKISNDEEISSLVTDIVQFDYAYLTENEI